MKRRRRFSRRERSLAVVLAGGKCANCGCDITLDTMHGDHVIPFSKGGSTTISNAQALCSRCNLQKGSSMFNPIPAVNPTVFTPRPHQQEALENFTRKCLGQGTQRNWLGVLGTGGGKTIAGALQIKAAIAAGKVKQAIVVIDANDTAKGWRDACATLGLRAVERDNAAIMGGAVPADAQVLITTYASLAVSSEPVSRFIRRRGPCMVVFDEPQHAAESATFGISIRNAFEDALPRVFLTATPVRTDRERIPFLEDKYQPVAEVEVLDHNGEVRKAPGYTITPDYECGYLRLLQANYVRAVYPVLVNQQVELINMTEMTQVEVDMLDPVGDPSEASARLRAAVNINGKTAQRLTKAAVECLLEMRKTRPDAKMLVVCTDQKAAKRVQEHIVGTFGIKCECIVSDDEHTTAEIDEFRRNDVSVATSVEKISEGVDIPAISIILWLTTVTTEMRIIQIIGRGVRNIARNPDHKCFVFMPADRRYAHYMRTFVDATLEFAAKRDGGDRDRTGEQDGPKHPRFIARNETPTDTSAVSIFSQVEHRGELLEEARRMKATNPSLQRMEDADIADILAAQRGITTPPPAPVAPAVAALDEGALRAAIVKGVNSLATRIGRKHAELNDMLNRAVGAPSREAATLPQLQQMLQMVNGAVLKATFREAA